MANWELWLTDDYGKRITLLNNISYATVARAISGYGTIHLGIPFEEYKVRPIFLPDRRIDVWRSPFPGISSRREGSFFLRKYNIYTREDGVQMIEFYGRSPIDILRRGSVNSYLLANYSKTDYLDNMMKAIVSENIATPVISPSGELIVAGNENDGPVISHSFQGQVVLDVLQELQSMSFSLSEIDANNKRIFFDVVEGSPLQGGGFGYIFRTYTEIRGTNRTLGTIFSIENGNIDNPSFYEDHLDSGTKAIAFNTLDNAVSGFANSPDRYLSRWNSITILEQSTDNSLLNNTSRANQTLSKNKADIALNVNFVDNPGSATQPRSLYGIDWDLGDLLPVRYGLRDFVVEVTNVYVSIDDAGQENIVGLSKLYSPTVAAFDNSVITKGFMMGGNTGVATAVIEDFIFVYETSQTITATLDTAKTKGAGVNSSLTGFIMGGSIPGVTAVIEDLRFINEISNVIAATLDTAKTAGTGVNSSTKGYIMGGFAGARTTVIEDLTFATEASVAIAATLNTAKEQGAGVNSSTKGYYMGGDTGVGVNTAVIEDLTFATEASVAIAATLNTAKTAGTGVNSSTKGYILGGFVAAVTAVIEDLTFATEASVAIAATLDTAKASGAGVNSSTKGYILGGFVAAAAATAVIEDLTFATEASVAIAATLNTAKYDGPGVQYGFV